MTHLPLDVTARLNLELLYCTKTCCFKIKLINLRQIKIVRGQGFTVLIIAREVLIFLTSYTRL